MEKYKIIVDTNLWISLLIGKRLSELRSICTSELVDVYICEEIKEEFKRIASREKIRKYATDERIDKTLELMEVSCILSDITETVVLSDLRDVNDLYLLAFADTVNADFLITGDKDLLALKSHNQTKIVTWKELETIIQLIQSI